ncbi:glycoside hydrolase family 18 protein, partial [Xylona heveae TC161]
MRSFIPLAATAVSILSAVSPALATFDPKDASNLAVYWGEGANQKRLSHFCDSSSIDIIPLSFMNVFPDQGAGGWPGMTFGNACGASTYTAPDGTPTQLLSDCQTLVEDIPYCQARGKKVLLSFGGSWPPGYYIKNDTTAVNFADFVWGAFGPKKDSWTGPRPFGDVSLDGFDFDIESLESSLPGPSYLSSGYATMISHLRELFAEEQSKDFYISGAPQCVIPDAHLADAVQNSWFDFLFIQFYNTPVCSARSSNISFLEWVDFVEKYAANKALKIYIGLPAGQDANNNFYLTLDEVETLVAAYKDNALFGGLMLWEATSSEEN